MTSGRFERESRSLAGRSDKQASCRACGLSRACGWQCGSDGNCRADTGRQRGFSGHAAFRQLVNNQQIKYSSALSTEEGPGIFEAPSSSGEYASVDKKDQVQRVAAAALIAADSVKKPGFAPPVAFRRI